MAEHFTHTLDPAQFQILIDVLSSLGDKDKLSAITKQLKASQKDLSQAIAADSPKP